MKITIKRIVFIIGILFLGLLVNSKNNTEELPVPSELLSMYIDSEIFMEDDIVLETWMTKPFLSMSDRKHNKIHNKVYEERLAVEAWMTKSFDIIYEDDLEIEKWMLKPFNV